MSGLGGHNSGNNNSNSNSSRSSRQSQKSGRMEAEPPVTTQGAAKKSGKAFHGDFDPKAYVMLTRFESYPDKALPDFIPEAGTVVFADWPRAKVEEFVLKAAPTNASKIKLDRIGLEPLVEQAGEAYIRLQPTSVELKLVGLIKPTGLVVNTGAMPDFKMDDDAEDLDEAPAWARRIMRDMQRQTGGSKVKSKNFNSVQFI